MNDRFKFRVWSNKYNDYLSPEIITTIMGLCKSNDLTTVRIGTLPSFDNNLTIEQCTGLKDKNGNLIYEGDVVSGRYFNPHHPKTPNPKIKGIVRFVQDRMTWIIKDGDSGYDFEDCMPTKDYFEIVGNIHEQKD